MNKEETNVLDIGCGTGVLGKRLTVLGFKHIDGLDASEGMLKLSKETGAY
jgi:predicted TPR repeat methyltransferase